MSVQAMSWVIEHSPHKHPEYTVLLMIASHANADGCDAYPSLTKLARKSRLSERQTLRALAKLEATGAIRVDHAHGRNRFVSYSVVMDAPTPAIHDTCSEHPSRTTGVRPDHASPVTPVPDEHMTYRARTHDTAPGKPQIHTSLEPSLSLSSVVADAIDGALKRFANRGYARDDRFLEALQAAYPELNMELEALTMAEWLLEPRHAKRPCSKNFIRNWLKRAEADRLGQEQDLAQRPAPTGPPWQANGAGTNGHYVQPQSQQRNEGPAPLREPTPEEEARSRAERDRVKQELAKRGLAGKYAGIGRAP